jgi:hypothetical protein
VFRSRNVAKYAIGSDFKGGQVAAIQQDKDEEGGLVVCAMPCEHGSSVQEGGDEFMGFLLTTRDPSKYKAGSSFSNGTINGTVAIVDTTRSLVLIRAR